MLLLMVQSFLVADLWFMLAMFLVMPYIESLTTHPSVVIEIVFK